MKFQNFFFNRAAAQDDPMRSSMRFNEPIAALADRLIRIASSACGQDLDQRLTQVVSRYRDNSFDPFGVDLETLRLAASLVVYFHRFYFRTSVYGIDQIPQGRALFVSNHSGQLPIDAVLITASLLLDAEQPRLVRNMVDRWVATLPFVSMWFSRLGQVIGAPENARLLLEREESLVAFPEGVAGVAKPFSRRYQLEPFGSGFMRLALETQTPIVPVAVIGAEEQYVSIADLKTLARLFGWPALPIIPQFLLGMFMPLPTKYHIYFGEPLRFTAEPEENDARVDDKVWVVRTTIQSMLDRGLKERNAVFW
jgi:1-acyl-sn-glycerol-3-phosphate acyltransferase